MTLIRTLATVLATAATTATVTVAGPSVATTVTHLHPWFESRTCAQEDSVNCGWNAGEEGNGEGHSYVVRQFPGKAHMVCVMYVKHADRKMDYCERG